MARRTNLRKNPRKARLHDRSSQPVPANVRVTAVTVSATNLLVTLNAPALYTGGVPAITCQGVLPNSIASVTPTTFILDYTAAVVATNAVVVPSNDPVFRTPGGGFITAGNFLVA